MPIVTSAIVVSGAIVSYVGVSNYRKQHTKTSLIQALADPHNQQQHRASRGKRLLTRTKMFTKKLVLESSLILPS